MDALRVEGLTKRYGETLALDRLGFALAPGRTLGLLGGNGAGKTTTIAMLLGLLIPTAGSIQVLGRDMARDRFAALARMNFSSPYVSLPARLSVAENLRVYGHLYGVRGLEARIRELAAQLDLGPLLNRAAGELSAGQKTRVALAKSLINRPDVLLLVGGTDGGDTAVLRHNAAALARHGAGVPVVLAGNTAVRAEVAAVLRDGGHPVTAVDNVLPDIGELAPEPARAGIRAVFLEHVIGGDRLSTDPRLRQWVRAVTPDAVLDGVVVLAGLRADADVGGVVVLDVGGAFGARRYESDDDVVLDVDGTRWSIGNGGCRRVRSRADVSVGHGMLGALVLGGAVWLAADRVTEPPPHSADAEAPASALRTRGVPTLGLYAAAMGVVFSSAEVTMVAFCGQHGHRGLSGAPLAAFAFGSAVAG